MMSQWVKVDTSLRNHPKLGRLAKRLGIGKAQAVGHLVLLWTWALEYAPDGVLASFDADEIADGGLWDGDDQEFIEALTASRFLEDVDGSLSIHDWAEYGGRLLEAKEQNRERQAGYRAARRDEHVLSTLEARAGLEKSRVDKRREDETRADAEGAPESSSSSSLKELLKKAVATDNDGMSRFLVDNLERLDDLAEYAERLDGEWQDAGKPDPPYLLQVDYFRNFSSGTRAFETSANRPLNQSELGYLADTVLSADLNEVSISEAVEEAALSWERPSVKYVAAIAARMSGIEWAPVGRCRELRTTD